MLTSSIRSFRRLVFLSTISSHSHLLSQDLITQAGYRVQQRGAMEFKDEPAATATCLSHAKEDIVTAVLYKRRKDLCPLFSRQHVFWVSSHPLAEKLDSSTWTYSRSHAERRHVWNTVLQSDMRQWNSAQNATQISSSYFPGLGLFALFVSSKRQGLISKPILHWKTPANGFFKQELWLCARQDI